MERIIPIVAAVIAFGVTAALGFVMIPFLRKLKFGQTILEDGPTWHKAKQGTPTMGGIMMVIGILAAMLVCVGISAVAQGSLINELKNNFRLTVLISGIVMALAMGTIGFLDDYIKVVKKRNLGLTARQKTFMQLLVSALYLATLAMGGMNTTYIPFIGDIDITHGFGLIFWPIALMFIYGFTNAVNLTDGVDGLASSVTLVVACAMMLASGHLYNMGMNTQSAALGGACVGFIVWNAKPAQVFMGDTGSMFIGGMVVALSFGIGRPILLIFAGCMYFIEAISVMLQVAYYKATKKRLFKMAPLHHHFEMCGWSEQKVVLIFSLISFIGCFISLLTVYFGW